MTQEREALEPQEITGLPMDLAPRDGSLLRLRVDYRGQEAWTPLEDAEQAWTIGSNNFDNDGEDRWRFAGWSWQQDFWCEGSGKAIGWLPFHDTAREEGRRSTPGDVEAAWCDCKVAYDLDDEEPIWAAWNAGTLRLPAAWELNETDGTGARLVVVFRVDGRPSEVDGLAVAAELRRLGCVAPAALLPILSEDEGARSARLGSTSMRPTNTDETSEEGGAS